MKANRKLKQKRGDLPYYGAFKLALSVLILLFLIIFSFYPELICRDLLLACHGIFSVGLLAAIFLIGLAFIKKSHNFLCGSLFFIFGHSPAFGIICYSWLNLPYETGQATRLAALLTLVVIFLLLLTPLTLGRLKGPVRFYSIKAIRPYSIELLQLLVPYLLIFIPAKAYNLATSFYLLLVLFFLYWYHVNRGTIILNPILILLNYKIYTVSATQIDDTNLHHFIMITPAHCHPNLNDQICVRHIDTNLYFYLPLLERSNHEAS